MYKVDNKLTTNISLDEVYELLKNINSNRSLTGNDRLIMSLILETKIGIILKKVKNDPFEGAFTRRELEDHFYDRRLLVSSSVSKCLTRLCDYGILHREGDSSKYSTGEKYFINWDYKNNRY